jgi:hypothetical protein
MLKFEKRFRVGGKIRAYDYDPKKVDGKELYAEGDIIKIVTAPYLAYLIACEKCTFSGREGQSLLVPMERASHEFDQRIIAIN